MRLKISLLSMTGLALLPALTLVQSAAADDKAEVAVVPDLAYYSGKDSDEKQHRLDLYLPRGRKNFPTVLFVHGGGYQRGDRKDSESLGPAFAKNGVAVAAISYRLYPKVMHPGHIQDVARAFRWVKENIGKHGGDAGTVFVSGHSAGAHLVSLLATDESYLKSEKCSLRDIKGVLAISGGYRIQPIRIEVFGDEKAMAQASPFSHISTGHPPFLLIYGSLEKKERHDISREFRDALVKAKSEAECAEIEGRDHKGLFAKIGEGDPTLNVMLKFISKHLQADASR